MRTSRIFLFMISIILLLLTPLPSEGNVKLAILPFNVNSPENLDYLRKGIMDMLASRVSSGGEVEVVDRAKVLSLLQEKPGGPKDLKEALALGRESGADFLVIGSITKLGKAISIDTQLLNVKKGTTCDSFSLESQTLDEVVPKISQLARLIKARILQGSVSKRGADITRMHRTTPGRKATLPQQMILGGKGTFPEPPGGYPIPPGGFPSDERDIFTKSDEPLILQGSREGEASLNPAFIMSYQADRARRGYVKSPELGIGNIQAIDVGDVDGDGFMETLIADEDHVYVFDDVFLRDSSRIVLPTRRLAKILSIDVADINRNGIPEIYITSIMEEGERLVSQVMEFRDGAFKVIQDGLDWFLRVTETPQEGKILLGQEKRIRFLTDRQSEDLYSPFMTPFRLKWKGDRLVKGEKLPIKEDVCILGLTMVDIDRDGISEYLAFDKNDYLKLFSARGNVIWASNEPYGRTANYFLKDLGRTVSPNEEPISQKAWLPARILTVDLDGDGFPEVILSHNYEPFKLLSQSRIFTKSTIISLSWDGVDFVENWRTREMKGYVSDYQVKDMDNDGKPELIVGLIYKSGPLDLFKVKATVIAYDLNIGRAKRKGL